MQGVSFADQNCKLWALVQRTAHAIYKARDKELSKFGISTMQAAVLLVVQAASEPATPAQISRWLFREPHSVSGLLNRMEKEGLVTRTQDLGKKNLVRVALTDKGQQALNLSMEREGVERIFSSLSEEQGQQLTACLEILLDKALEELRMGRKLPFA